MATAANFAGNTGTAGVVATGLAWWWAGTALSIPAAVLGSLVASGGWADVEVMGASHGLGLGLAAWGMFVERWWVRTPTLELPVAALAPGFDGYRVVHLSDLHISRFTPARRVKRWERQIRELDPDLIVVTGDLSSRTAYRTRDVAEVLGRLSARDGVVVSFGNHEQRCAGEVARAIAELAPAVRLLRGGWLELRRGDARLHLLGLDDWDSDPGRFAVGDARPASGPVVLLAHSRRLAHEILAAAPALAPAIVLMGHTHGGQIGVPGLGRWLNLTLLTGQWARRLSFIDGRWEFVNAGLGTSGPPLRLGVRPEMPTLVLRCGAGTMP